MGVAYHLGFDDDRSDVLVSVAHIWSRWQQLEPALHAVVDFEHLRPWLCSASTTDVDDTLRALAVLANIEEGADPLAASALSWALLPGARALANRLSDLSPRIDEIVASQLWIEIRTRASRPRHKIAANVLMNTRAGVLRECGVRSQVERTDKTLSRTWCVDPSDLFGICLDPAASADDDEVEPEDELRDLLSWACANNVIAEVDRALLMALVWAADEAPTTRIGRGQGGLMSNELSAHVADQWGIAPATVRRRAHRAVASLTEAARTRRIAA